MRPQRPVRTLAAKNSKETQRVFPMPLPSERCHWHTADAAPSERRASLSNASPRQGFAQKPLEFVQEDDPAQIVPDFRFRTRGASVRSTVARGVNLDTFWVLLEQAVSVTPLLIFELRAVGRKRLTPRN
jgi:hypothetical protein